MDVEEMPKTPLKIYKHCYRLRSSGEIAIEALDDQASAALTDDHDLKLSEGGTAKAISDIEMDPATPDKTLRPEAAFENGKAQQKSRKRKHRPKVITQANPTFTEPLTPDQTAKRNKPLEKSQTTGSKETSPPIESKTRFKGSSTGLRTYVRRKLHKPTNAEANYSCRGSLNFGNGASIPVNFIEAMEPNNEPLAALPEKRAPNEPLAQKRKLNVQRQNNITTHCARDKATEVVFYTRRRSVNHFDTRRSGNQSAQTRTERTNYNYSKQQNKFSSTNIAGICCYNGVLRTNMQQSSSGPPKKRSRTSTRPRDLDFLTKIARGELREMRKNKRTKGRVPLRSYGTYEQSHGKMMFNGRSPMLLGFPAEIWMSLITQKLQQLDINRETSAEIEQNGAIVPFAGANQPIKKRKPRARVDLDQETGRVWRLLLENINSQGIDGTDEDNAKWWKQERHVFSGRANSFIARMHIIQGDRHFTPWKGSVLDSVVGVFLTQNVSDHLSSSAFMSLAANFPLKSASHEYATNDMPNQSISGQSSELYEERLADHSSEPSSTSNIIDDAVSSQNSEVSSQNSADSQGKTESDLTDHGLQAMKGLAAQRKAKARRVGREIRDDIDWNALKKKAKSNGIKREKTYNTMDSVDWEAIRCADVDKIADAIKMRGMNNVLAGRIQDFLNRLVREHGSIDLEWLRDVPPDKAKEYLLTIRGLGLKSVECVRLLTLHQLAFPVDTNVGRIAVRLGWVPLQPLPESLQLHLLELYPVVESIQQYLWPRLCKLDQKTLYELHYQMITFGKVFCTKNKPNCNSCPMRGECRHFASAFASARLALPGPEEISTQATEKSEENQLLELKRVSEVRYEVKKCVPIVEEPSSPESECTQVAEIDIEDSDSLHVEAEPDEIATIKLNIEEFTQNLQNYMQNNMELQEGEMSKALVALTGDVASIPMPKLKNASRLRTEHHVYELPDFHPLLKGLQRREADDPCSYLLAIWTPGETANSNEPPESTCNLQEQGKFCGEKTCFSCNSVREVNSQIVRGTLLIPCRTAMRGSFPLNGTYFQVNEVFADHDSSMNPIEVPRSWLWSLPRRTVYFGTSIPTIFKGLTTEGVQHCFWRGYVCVRGFDQKTRAPRPLLARLHFTASRLNRKEGYEQNE